jgi:hypothetical protein
VNKTNHASQNTVIVYKKDDINRRNLQGQLVEWLKYNYYLSGRQWAYKNIDRKILVERLLLDETGAVPTDYKFFCFDGEVRFVQVDTGRFSDHRRDFYDVQWRRLPFRTGLSRTVHFKRDVLIYDNAREVLPEPKNLSLMREVAESLAEDFRFVRVDLYDLGRKVIFGEITHYPESGYTAFMPTEYDAIIGDHLSF